MVTTKNIANKCLSRPRTYVGAAGRARYGQTQAAGEGSFFATVCCCSSMIVGGCGRRGSGNYIFSRIIFSVCEMGGHNYYCLS